MSADELIPFGGQRSKVKVTVIPHAGSLNVAQDKLLSLWSTVHIRLRRCARVTKSASEHILMSEFSNLSPEPHNEQ